MHYACNSAKQSKEPSEQRREGVTRPDRPKRTKEKPPKNRRSKGRGWVRIRDIKSPKFHSCQNPLPLSLGGSLLFRPPDFRRQRPRQTLFHTSSCLGLWPLLHPPACHEAVTPSNALRFGNADHQPRHAYHPRVFLQISVRTVNTIINNRDQHLRTR